MHIQYPDDEQNSALYDE